MITRFTTSPGSRVLIISNYKNAANSKTLILHPLYLVGIDLFYIIIFYNGNRVNHIRFRSTVIWKGEYSEKIHFLSEFVKRISKVTRKLKANLSFLGYYIFPLFNLIFRFVNFVGSFSITKQLKTINEETEVKSLKEKHSLDFIFARSRQDYDSSVRDGKKREKICISIELACCYLIPLSSNLTPFFKLIR